MLLRFAASPCHASLFILGVLAACGGAPADVPDAGVAPDAGPTGEAAACAAIPDDAPAPPAGALDGVYAASEILVFGGDGIRPACIVRDATGELVSGYLEVSRGEARFYARVYTDASACLEAGFDQGGRVETTSVEAWRACGTEQTSDDGTFRQVAVIADRADSWGRMYRYVGAGPADTRWKELIVSTLSSSSPFAAVPNDLRFLRYRRPR